eukprot:12925239-Prorocentrum_lima.AAC.1
MESWGHIFNPGQLCVQFSCKVWYLWGRGGPSCLGTWGPTDTANLQLETLPPSSPVLAPPAC